MRYSVSYPYEHYCESRTPRSADSHQAKSDLVRDHRLWQTSVLCSSSLPRIAQTGEARILRTPREEGCHGTEYPNTRRTGAVCWGVIGAMVGGEDRFLMPTVLPQHEIEEHIHEEFRAALNEMERASEKEKVDAAARLN